MRAVLVSTEFPPGPGGIGTHAFELARGLVGRGWRVRVHAPQDYVDDEERAKFDRELAKIPLTLDRVARRFGRVAGAPGRWRALLACVRAHKPDVVIASGRASNWLCAAVAQWMRVPWVAIGHGTEFGMGRSLGDRVTRWALQRANGVICVSEFTRRRMHELGIEPRADTVIPNGADPRDFPASVPARVAAWRAGHGLVGKRVLLTLGHLSERKGQDLVVRALPRIRERVPNVAYVAVGMPTRADHLRALARELGVADCVHMPGRVSVSDRLAWLHAADVFVLTSRITADGDCEGFGIAAVEAAFCGVPAVVAGGSGLAEAVADGVSGFVVPPENPAAIADAVRALCMDDALRQRMGEAARRRALDEQTWERRAAEYDAWLRERLAPAITRRPSGRTFASSDVPAAAAASRSGEPVP